MISNESFRNAQFAKVRAGNFRIIFANLTKFKMLQAFQRLSLTSTQYYTQLSTNQFSQRLLDCPPFKRLDSLVITNFKSFRGKVYVGPLLEFTSIVGPNGVGKSNILDALMFTFCNEKSKVSFFDIRQFINRQGIETYKEMSDKKKFCEVEVRFVLGNDRYFTLSRKLYPDEQQVFQIDGEEYSQKVYENFLMKNNINYVSSNYAIWQGEIDKLLLKSPKELTNYIETISGSIFFRKEQDELKQQIQDIQEHMKTRGMRVFKLKQEKKHLKTFQHQKNSTLKMQAQYQLLLKQIVLAKAYLSELQLKEFSKTIQKIEAQQQKRIKVLNQTKAQIQREQAEKVKLQLEANKLMKSIAQNNSKIRAIGQLSNVIDVQAIAQFQKEIQSLAKYQGNLTLRKTQLQRQIDQLPSTDQNKEYLDLYAKWQRQNQAINKELTKRKEEYLYTSGILQAKRNILEEFNQKQLKSEQMAKEETRQRAEIQKNIQELEKTISQMRVEHAKLSEEFAKNGKTIQNLQKKIIEANEKTIDLQALVSESLQNQKDKQIIFKLNSVEGFKGLIQQWLKPSNKKYENCFHMLVGPILKYLLCIDEASSKQVTIKLRQNYQIRNLIILNNVHEKKELVPRSAIGKLGFPAIDAIDFDKKLHNFDIFLKEYLNGKVICQNLQAAWKLLGQNIRGIKEIYTLDGNVLRQDGVVSSQGSAQHHKNKYKYVDSSKIQSTIMQDIQSLHKEKAKLEEEMQKIKKKSNEDMLARHSIEMQRLQSKKQQLSLKLSLLNKSIQSKKESKVSKGIENQIQELQKKVGSLQKGVIEIEKQMLRSNIFTEFLHKHNISTFDNFRSVQDLSSLETTIKNKNKLTKELQATENQIGKIQNQIVHKRQKMEKLSERVNSIKGFSEKQDIQAKIKKEEAELSSIRLVLSKLKNVNLQTLKFKSQIPQMTAKLQIMRQRHEKLIKSQAQHLGLNQVPSLTEYHLLQQPLGIKIERATRERMELVEEELWKEKMELEKELERNNITLTDIRSQFDNEDHLEEEITRITEQLKEDNQQKNQLNQNLEKVKSDRKALFMNYINHLKPILQQAYQILTQRQSGHGRVDIFMQNQSFPCDQGLYYTPVPPTKRFVYDLDQLSGGEKSIASLALQYAIAIASKSPFLILDETDAFLDSENTKRFINLIRKTLSDRKLQFIIITHKRSLFLSGESLVGVTKFKDDPFSKAFSLRINEPDGQFDGEFQ